MNCGFSRFVLIIFFFAATATFASVCGQNRGIPEEEDFPKSIKETLAKNRIEREKKDFQELLERGAEAAKLSEEVNKSFVENKRLTPEDRRKLERLEKISKKIREDIGANNDSDAEEDEETKVSSTSEAVDKLKNISQKLAEELKKTSRYTISAVAVQSSNAVLKIVRFVRQVKN